MLQLVTSSLWSKPHRPPHGQHSSITDDLLCQPSPDWFSAHLYWGGLHSAGEDLINCSCCPFLLRENLSLANHLLYDSIRPKCIKRLVFDSQLDQFPTQRQIVYFHQLFVFLSWLVICPWYCGMRKQPNKRSAGPRTRQLEVLLARHQVVFGEKLPNVSTAGAGVCL